MRPLSPPATLLAICLSIVSLAGCGSSGGSSGNGVAAQSPSGIVAATKAAADGATSVRVAGSIVNEGSAITLDLNLLTGKGGRGRISENGLSFELIVLGDSVYIKGSPTFYRHFAGAAAAQLFQGKWLKASAASSDFASIASLTDLRKLLDSALGSHGSLAKGSTSTIDGQGVIGVNDTSRGGTLYVATSGTPYPIAIVKSGKGGGRVVFDHWNEPVALAAPANAVDIAQLQAGH